MATGRTPPGAAQTALMRGYAFHQRGDLQQAAQLYRAVLAANPSSFEALSLLGVLEGQSGRAGPAADLLARAVRARPSDAGVHVNYGNVLRQLKRPADALASYDRALRIEPGNVGARYNRGLSLADLGRHAEALADYDRVTVLAPGNADAWHGRGNALRVLHRPEEALAAYERAIALKPGDPDVWVNRGVILQSLRRHREALESYARAQAVAPTSAAAHLNEGLCRLLLGEFATGWAKYQWRWRTPESTAVHPNYPQPQLRLDADLAGKTVLLHAEQGFGDTLQFCRYAPLVAARGAAVVLDVQPSLVELLSGMPGVAQVVARGGALPAFDYHCAFLDLPAVFGTTLDSVPAVVPYLCADPARARMWNVRLGTRTGPRVGLAWSGSGALLTGSALADDDRAVPLAQLATLCVPGRQYVSLHTEVRPGDRDALAAHPEIREFATELKSFADTAALIDQLDLVVTVDTAVAHLAGALGKPVWLLLPYNVTWRWLLDRADSPWYPTARLFRQPVAGDWAAVISAVRAELDRR